MLSIESQVSRASANAQTIISKLASRNGEVNGLTMVMDEEAVSAAWNAFGLYLSRQLRMGRGVAVGRFGTFSFSAPEVKLDGVTNPLERDKQPRQPVFLVAKEFVNGLNLKTAIAIGRTLRPYKVQTSGMIQHAIINYAEIALYANQNKDSAKLAVNRVIKQLADIARNKQMVEVDIPAVGTLLVKNGLAAVSFHQSLQENCREITKRPLSERKQKGDMKLTQSYLQQFGGSQSEEAFHLDQNTQNYLTQSLGIDAEPRPTTAKSFISKQKLMSKTIEVRPQTSQKTNVNDRIYAMERLKFFIRDNAWNIEDSFINVCNYSFGRTSERKLRMNFDDFKTALQKIQLPVNEQQIMALFLQCDVNGDGFIDKFDWMKAMVDRRSHINYIKDVVFKFKIHTDDLLQRMGLNRDHAPVGVSDLKAALMCLDESLNHVKATHLARDILDGKERITMQDLVSMFDTIEEEDKSYDASWFKDILHRMRSHLVEPSKFTKLQQQFEFFDEHQEGNLDTANFKTVLMEADLGLQVQDINRLVRYIPKVRNSLINYYDFMGLIMDVNKQADQKDTAKDLVDFAQKVARWLERKKFTVIFMLQQVKSSYGSCCIDEVAQYLEKQIFTKLSHEECVEYVREMDVDGNGVVSDDDLNTFIKRYSYFYVRKDQNTVDQILDSMVRIQSNDRLAALEQSCLKAKSIDLITLGQTKPFQTLLDNVQADQNKTLFPIQALPEDKFDKILKDLRIKLALKGMSYAELFALLDTDHNGFLSISEFQNIDAIIPLSQPAKDGFFAFMDRQRIGLIDVNTFTRMLSKSIIKHMESLTEDDWDWQMEILFKMRNWCQRENITIEDAFRTFDKDFDGQINKNDLRTFLHEVLKVELKEITEAKLNRLFKLMDQYKRGRITLMDFRRFMEEGFFAGKNVLQKSSTSSFDWKANAKQQIGLIISRHYPSVKDSFDIVSGYRKKLVFQKFKKWIEEKNALAGFDLTEKLIYEIFSDLDTHKKGYLAEQDWLNAFSQFNWLDQMVLEMRDAMSTYFSSILHAIHYFQQEHSHVITKASFKRAIESLFPKRFHEGDIDGLWNRVQKNGTLSNQAFALIFEKKDQLYQTNELQRPHTQGETRNQQNITILDRIRRYLRNSNINIKDLITQYDPSDTGKITNLEFRQVIRALNMGLTSQDIDILSALLELDRDSMVNWKDFVKRLEFRQADNKILDRAALHLQKVNDHIYHYLLSPKDAFRQIDALHSGHLTFDQFKDMIEMLYRLATEEVPPFAIIKDLFEFIDKRRDGLIDLTEWMDAFGKFQNPHEKRRPQSAQLRKKRHLPPAASFVKFSPIHEKFEGIVDDGLMNALDKFKTFLRKPSSKELALQYVDNGLWESSKEFDRTIMAIGKNRKYLLDIFKAMSQQGYQLTDEVIRDQIDKMLRSQNIIVREEQWAQLILWSKKNGRIDYKFLLEVYKDRLNGMDTQPR